MIHTMLQQSIVAFAGILLKDGTTSFCVTSTQKLFKNKKKKKYFNYNKTIVFNFSSITPIAAILI